MSSLKQYAQEPLVSIVMTSHNVEKYIRGAIDSIIAQTYQRWELIVVDDASTDNTRYIVQDYNDPRIRLFENKINAGTYFCKNFGIQQAKGKYIAIHDSDDKSTPDRLEKQVDYLKEHHRAVLVKCQYTRVDHRGQRITEPRLGFQTAMIRKWVFDKIGLYDTVRVAGDDEFDNRVGKEYGGHSRGAIKEVLYYNLSRPGCLTKVVPLGGLVRKAYVREYTKWHRSNKNIVMPFPQERRPFPVDNSIKVKNTSLEGRFQEIRTKAHRVTASVASIPARSSSLKKVVKDLLPQVDRLVIYLNNYDTIPRELINDKIELRFSQAADGDVADNGKFYDLQRDAGFHFTVDDDIHYPENYVKNMIEAMARYDYRAIAGYHAIRIRRKQFQHYYDLSSRFVDVFCDRLKQDLECDFVGTGVMAYHTNTIEFEYDKMIYPRMVDIWVGIQAREKKVPFFSPQRREGYLKEHKRLSPSIYQKHKHDDEVQTNLIRSNYFSLPVPNIKTTLEDYHAQSPYPL
jgi:glycosyltransferase involved in cell wall biosynthesis